MKKYKGSEYVVGKQVILLEFSHMLKNKVKQKFSAVLIVQAAISEFKARPTNNSNPVNYIL